MFVRTVFQEDKMYYLQVSLGAYLHELQWVEYDRIGVSEGIDVNRMNASKHMVFVIIGDFQIKILNMNHVFAMVVMI